MHHMCSSNKLLLNFQVFVHDFKLLEEGHEDGTSAAETSSIFEELSQLSVATDSSSMTG